MAKAKAVSTPAPETKMETPDPTTAGIDTPATSLELLGKDEYIGAHEDNRRFDFERMIVEARAPKPEPVHVQPAVPPLVAEQTRLEMEAGRKRVLEAEAREAERKAITERHKNDKWQKSNSEQVFRPADYVPDPRKNQGQVGGTTATV